MDEHEYLENVDPELMGRLLRATAEGRMSRRQLLKYMGFGVGGVSLASILAACTGGSSPNPSPSGSGGTTGGGTLTIAARQTPNGLDHDLFFGEEDQEIRAAIYENLMAFSTTQQTDGLIVPDYDVSKMEGRLAESWEVSSDQRTLTLHLRQGVMCHAGNEFTADDVQYTWDRGWAVNGSSAFYAQVIFGFKKPNWTGGGPPNVAAHDAEPERPARHDDDEQRPQRARRQGDQGARGCRRQMGDEVAGVRRRGSRRVLLEGMEPGEPGDA